MFTRKINLINNENVEKFVRKAEKCSFDINVVKDSTTVDGKSVLGIMGLDRTKSIDVQLITDNNAEADKFWSEVKDMLI